MFIAVPDELRDDLPHFMACIWCRHGQYQKKAHSNCFIVFIPNDVHRYQRDPGQEQDIKHMEELADTKRWELHLGWAFFQCEGSKKIKLRCHSTPQK